MDPTCYLFNPLGENIAERAKLIADAIDPDRYDIIVFNEVRDEDDGKDVVTARLCEAYPHFVRYVDVFGGGFEEDSGLMVFSTFPFDPLPDQQFVSEDNEGSGGDDSDRIACVKFDDCAGDDCLVAKGAVLVRAKHPSSGRIVNVVTTHLNADEDDVNDGIRAKQLRQILGQCETGIATTHPNLVHGTIAPALSGGSLCNWPVHEWLLVMGDLNVQGAGAIGNAQFPAAVPAGGPSEWTSRFGFPAANATSTGYALYDAWAETTTEMDRGATTDADQRLDYILASRVTDPVLFDGEFGRQLCVQYIRVPPEFEGLSDHRAVAADINLGAPQCSPRAAVEPSPDDLGELGGADGKEAKQLDGRITHPGSMQWWRLAEAGTYAVAASAGVSLEFYRADDLSRPLGGSHALGKDTINACRYFGEGRKPVARCREAEADKLVFPAGPTYIRVFADGRKVTTDYWIAVHKYTCKSVAEACELLPHAPYRFDFPPAGQPLNPEDAAWFRIQVREQADSGQPQSVRFYVENRTSTSWPVPQLELRDGNGAAVLTQLDGQPLAGPTAGTSPGGKENVAIDGATGQNDTVVLRVARADVNSSLQLLAGWRTNLILLGGSAIGPKPAKLICEDETNPEAGEDEINLEVKVDGGGFQTRGSAGFDCNDKEHFRPWNGKLGVIRYLDSVAIRVTEGDATSPDDESQQVSVDDSPFAATDVTVSPLPHKVWWEFEGGRYSFFFNTGKWRVD